MGFRVRDILIGVSSFLCLMSASVSFAQVELANGQAYGITVSAPNIYQFLVELPEGNIPSNMRVQLTGAPAGTILSVRARKATPGVPISTLLAETSLWYAVPLYNGSSHLSSLTLSAAAAAAAPAGSSGGACSGMTSAEVQTLRDLFVSLGLGDPCPGYNVGGGAGNVSSGGSVDTNGLVQRDSCSNKATDKRYVALVNIDMRGAAVPSTGITFQIAINDVRANIVPASYKNVSERHGKFRGKPLWLVVRENGGFFGSAPYVAVTKFNKTGKLLKTTKKQSKNSDTVFHRGRVITRLAAFGLDGGKGTLTHIVGGQHDFAGCFGLNKGQKRQNKNGY